MTYLKGTMILSGPEMPELEETNENKEDSDEDSDLPPLEVM